MKPRPNPNRKPETSSVRKKDKLIRRKSDGRLFRASYPEEPNKFAEVCMRSLSGRGGWYFRQVAWKPRKWFQFRGRWVDTGNVWEPESYKEFELVTP